MSPSVTAAPHAGRRPSLAGFFLAAVLVAGLGMLPMVLASHRGPAAVPPLVRSLQLLLFFGPAALAIAWAAREGGWPAVRALLARLGRWRVHPAWYAAVLLGPALLPLAALLVARALGATTTPVPATDHVLAAFVPSFLGYLLLNTEELAWRGYAWPRLAARFGFLRGSLVLGAAWGLLHTPLFLMRGGHPGGFPPWLFGAMVIVFGVLFSLVYEGTGRSLLLVHLLHQSLNAWGDAIGTYPRLTRSIVPTALFIGAAAVVAVWGVRKAGWRWREENTESSLEAAIVAA